MTRRKIFLSVSAAVVLAVIVVAHQVLLPFVLAMVIAYVLTPLVAWVEKKRVPRAAAIIIVYVVVLGSLASFVRVTAPRVGAELGNLRRELPSMVNRARDEWVPAVQTRLRELGLTPPLPPPTDKVEPEQPAFFAHPQADGTIAIEIGSGVIVQPTGHGGYILEPARAPKDEQPFDPNRFVGDAIGKSFAYAQHNALELARIGRDIVSGISRVIFIFGITLMLGAYTILTRERILGFFESLCRPQQRADFTRLLARIDRGLSGVVRGQLIICIVNGLLSAIGFAMVGLKYWPVLALVATVLSLIPIFGVIASSIPAVALGLTQSIGTAAFVLLWIIGIHQIEANLLNPKIMGDAAKIHPVLVIFSLLVGEHFFGIVGALLAVPCMSIAQSLFLHFLAVVEADDPDFQGKPVETLPPPVAAG